MKSFIVYTLKGEILRTGQCQDSDLFLQGEYVIEGMANDATQYIENGQIIDMPPKPDVETFFDYESKEWVLNPISQEFVVKQKRNSLLAESDWTQLPDVPLETKQAWVTYRQALRDITTQEGYPFNVIWPTKPE